MGYSTVFLFPKHDTNEASADAFMVETDGDIHIQTAGGNEITLPVEAGSIYPIRLNKVFITGTTVGEVYGLV